MLAIFYFKRQASGPNRLAALKGFAADERNVILVPLVAGSILAGCATNQPASRPSAAPPQESSGTPAPPPAASPPAASSPAPPSTPAAPAPDPRTAQANELLLAGKPDEAARLLSALTAEHPGDALAWDLLTLAYTRAGNADLAVWAGRKALALVPASPTAQFNAALALRPDAADTYYNLGAAYELAGSTPEATAAYEKGLARFPADGDLKRALAALRGDLNLDGKPERIAVQGQRVSVTDEAGHQLARWEEPTNYTPPSRVWQQVVDLGGRVAGPAGNEQPLRSSGV